MYKNLVILALALLSWGCVGKGVVNDNIVVDFDATKHSEYTISETVALETTNDVLVGKNYKLHINDKFYIITDQKAVMVFSKEGKAIHKFSPLGQAPEEVISISNVAVNNDYIEIFDISRSKLVRYGFDGTFINTIDLPKNINEFVFLNNLLISDNQGKDEKVLALYNSKNEIVKKDIQSRAKGLNYGFGSKFCKDADRVLYLPSFYNQIYAIDKDGDLDVAYSFDFGSHWASEEECETHADHGNVFSLWKHLKKENKIGFLKFFKNNNWIVLDFELQDKQYVWFYNESTKVQFMQESTSKVLGKTKCAYNGDFFAVYDAADYLNTFGDGSKEITEESNPVIVRYRFAD